MPTDMAGSECFDALVVDPRTCSCRPRARVLEVRRKRADRHGTWLEHGEFGNGCSRCTVATDRP